MNNELLYSKKGLKNYTNFTKILEHILNGKKCVMFGQKYVVIDRRSYDKMIEKLNPSLATKLEFNEYEHNNWIKEAFTGSKS